MQAINLFGGGPKPSTGVDSPTADKECDQYSTPADKECDQSSSVLSDRIRDLENRAKSRGESQE